MYKDQCNVHKKKFNVTDNIKNFYYIIRPRIKFIYFYIIYLKCFSKIFLLL